MPARPWRSNFTGGELTEQLDGRVDLARYANGAACLKNFVVRPHGGVARRAGLLYVNTVKDPTKRVRLVKFEFSRSITYLMEFGDLYIRFYFERALLRSATLTPATTMTLSAATGFSVTATAGAATFTNTNTDRGRLITIISGGNTGVAVVKTVSSTTVASVAVLTDFTDTTMLSGEWTITGNPVEVTTPYLEADLRALRFEQVADVLYIAHQSYAPRKLTRLTATTFELTLVSFNPVPTFEEGIPLLLTGVNTMTLSATTGTGQTVTFAGAHAPFLPDVDGSSDIGRTLSLGTGRAVIMAVTSTTVATLDIQSAFPATSNTSGTATIGLSPFARLEFSSKGPAGTPVAIFARNSADTADVDAFRASDLNDFVVGGGGVAQIYQVVSATQVNAVIKSEFTDFLSDDGTDWFVQPGGWTLETETWTAARGYPGVVRMADQRLFWMSSPAEPDHLWGSHVGDYENHALGPNDADAVSFELGGSQVDTIRWAAFLDTLLVGTIGGEYAVTGAGIDEPITPTSLKIRGQSRHGADFTVDVLLVGNAAVFLQRGATRLREMLFSVEAAAYLAPDLFITAEHLGRVGVLETTATTAPDSYILAVLDDGRIAACTYEKTEQVVGWAHLITGAAQDMTDGVVESVCALPNMCNTGDEIWVAVKRTIDGSDTRYVEVFDGALTTDSALVYAGAATDRFRGLGHLEGEVVYAITGDDAAYTVHTVADGEIQLAATATAVEIGLLYVPYLKTLRPEVATGQGSLQGRRQRVSEVYVRVYCTRGAFTVNGQTIAYPAGTTFPYTGDVDIGKLGWDRHSRIEIQQDEPFPITVLSVGLGLGADDG